MTLCGAHPPQLHFTLERALDMQICRQELLYEQRTNALEQLQWSEWQICAASSSTLHQQDC